MDRMDSKLVELLTVSLQIGTLPGTFHFYIILKFLEKRLYKLFWMAAFEHQVY